MNLLTKVSAVIVGVTVLIGAIVGFVVYTLNSGQAERMVGQSQLNVAVSALDTIDRVLNDSYGNIQAFAKLKQAEDFFSSPDAARATSLREQLEEMSVIYGLWDTLFVVDKSNKVLVATTRNLEGRIVDSANTAESDLISRAFAGHVAYSDSFVSSLTGERTVAFAMPVRSSKGEKNIVGVIVGHVDWNIITEILASTDIETHLLDREGKSIVVVGQGGEHDEYADHGIEEAIEAGVGTVHMYDEKEGESVLISYAKEAGYFDYHGNGWMLLLERSASEAFADAQYNALLIVGVLALGGLFIAALGVFFFQRLIVSPIHKLTEASKKISAGDLNQVIDVRSNDEIGVLATVFNKMTSNLQELYSGMEKKVSEKTALLETKLSELERVNKLMVDRELKMIELKKENEALKAHAGTPQT